MFVQTMQWTSNSAFYWEGGGMGGGRGWGGVGKRKRANENPSVNGFVV